jgi:two-component sensor histidine kinase
MDPGNREPSYDYFLAAIHPDDRNAVDASLEAAMTGGAYKAAFRIVLEDGTVKMLESTAEVTTDAHGEPVSMIGVVQDITDRVAAEQRLTVSLREKEVLLREIHHRVKNNMQVVSGLLELQARRVQDEQARQALRDSVNRIRSMAMIHEKLYRSEELASVDPTTYIADFTRELVGTYGSDGIHLRLEVERLPLTVDQAIPCGLVLNELISNALKHGFPQGGPGNITVSLLESADGTTEMSVANDGAALPADFDWERAGTLGMRLVRNLALQLGGSIQVERLNPGTRFRLRFTRVAPCSNPGS